jgi:uncharacterized protein (DUF169 family)
MIPNEEDMMAPSNWDIQPWKEALRNLNLEVPPVGVRFSSRPPEGLQPLDDRLRLCEMLKRAQGGNAFYASPDNHACTGGLYIMGKELPHAYTTGEYVEGMQLYESSKAGRRIYDSIPRLDAKSGVDYVAFSPLEKLTFAPDLLIILGQADQTEVLLRAFSYSTGKVWMSRCTGVIGCSWTYMYPYTTGDLNFVVTGLSLGMRAAKLYPQGLQLVSIPSDLFPVLLHSLKNMPSVVPMLEPGADEFRKNLLTRLGLDPSH